MSSPNADAASRRALSERGGKLGGVVHDPHALAAAAGRRLHQDGEADVGGTGDQVVVGQPGPRNAGHHRHPERRHRGLRGDLVAHRLDRRDRRTDEHDARRLQGGGELCVLRKESVAGVDGLRAGAPGGRDDGVDGQVALPGRRGTDADRDVGLGDVAGAGVGVAEHRDRADPHRAQRADDPHGDLAAVGDQNGVELTWVMAPHIRKTP